MFGLFKNIFGKSDTKALQQLLSNGAFLVDVRTPGEFMQGHVTGSVNIPLNQVQAMVSKFTNKNAVVVFCRSGARSAQAKMILQNNGIANVVNGGPWTQVQQLVQASAG